MLHLDQLWVCVLVLSSGITSATSWTPNQGKKTVLGDLEGALNKLAHTECGKDITTFLSSLEKKEKWAIQMYESSPKSVEGFFYDNHHEFGEFDQCINHQTPIRRQYCLSDIDLAVEKEPQKKKTIYWSICVPSSCTTHQVQDVIKATFTPPLGHRILKIQVDEEMCEKNQQQSYTMLEEILKCVFFVYILFVVLVTLYHYYTQPSECQNSLLSFSLINSVKTLRQNKSEDLDCIHGIKFWSMLHIMGGHNMAYSIGSPLKNIDFYQQKTQEWRYAIFTNALLGADTFLTLSGFLMTHSTLKTLDKSGKLNIFRNCIKRYWRITPTYLVTIVFYSTFFLHSGNGPLWYSRIKREKDRCIRSWWANLLYINNYVATDHMCLPQSWQLAVDFQLFILGSLCIYVLWRWRRMGKVVLGAVFLFSVVLPGVLTYRNRLEPTIIISNPKEMYDHATQPYFKNFYIKTHTRAHSYLIGVIFGYLLHTMQKQGIKVPKLFVQVTYLTTTLTILLCLVSIIRYYDPDYQYDAVEVAVYACLHKVVWAIAISWGVLVCALGQTPLVNSFLSWGFFSPYSKLGFCAFLSNGFIGLYTLASTRVPPYVTKNYVVRNCFADVILTFQLAAVVAVFFEIPVQKFRDSVSKRKID